MKTLKLKKALKTTIFTHEEIANLLKDEVSNVNAKISYMVKQGILVRLKKGLYSFSELYRDGSVVWLLWQIGSMLPLMSLLIMHSLTMGLFLNESIKFVGVTVSHATSRFKQYGSFKYPFIKDLDLSCDTVTPTEMVHVISKGVFLLNLFNQYNNLLKR